MFVLGLAKRKRQLQAAADKICKSYTPNPVR